MLVEDSNRTPGSFSALVDLNLTLYFLTTLNDYFFAKKFFGINKKRTNMSGCKAKP